MSALLNSILSPEFGFAIFRVMTPLLFAALGIAISTMARVTNISMEGTMLISAFVGVIVSAFTGSLLLALACGLLTGVAMSSVLAYFHLRLRANIFLAAIALNFLADGLTVFLLFLFAGDKGSSSSLASLTFPDVHIPLIRNIPILGDIISGHNVLTYFSLLSVLLFYVLVFRTPLGLRIRAVGQNPAAAASVGINVDRTRLYALMLSGLLGALGGLNLSMGYVSWFARNMTAGRGWIAIAAATLGNSLPLGVFLSTLLFGTVNTVAIYFATLRVPSEFIQMLPYAITVLVLVIYAIRTTRMHSAHKARRTAEAPHGTTTNADTTESDRTIDTGGT